MWLFGEGHQPEQNITLDNYQALPRLMLVKKSQNPNAQVDAKITDYVQCASKDVVEKLKEIYGKPAHTLHEQNI